MALEAKRRFETKSPVDCYRGEVLWLLHLAHAAARSAPAPSLLQEAARWVHEVARERVPEQIHPAPRTAAAPVTVQ